MAFRVTGAYYIKIPMVLYKLHQIRRVPEIPSRLPVRGAVPPQGQYILYFLFLQLFQNQQDIVPCQVQARNMGHALYAVFMLNSRRNLKRCLTVLAATRPICDADEIRGDSLKLIQRVIDRVNGRCPFGRKNLQGQYCFMVEQ